ncbi:MAG: hypothetical protein ABIS50_10195 [Luteolibacter sp.]|uniref:hypothetical protein n=1 Tax=Luteolibacter sp. TaxID=1962973 RepID=UPI003263C2C2
MIGPIVKRFQLSRRRKIYQIGAELCRFIAKDIKREIRVLDASGIDEGYVVAQVRTQNVLHASVGREPESPFGDPEILHVDRAWLWGGESWGGAEALRPRIPLITASDLKDLLSSVFPQATFESEITNADFGSWRLTVTQDYKEIEFVWGPLSGFGGIDPEIHNEDVFAHCDEYLYSKYAAIAFARDHLKIEQAEEGDPNI